MTPVTVMNVSHYKHEHDFFHQVIENGFGPDIYLFVHFILPAVVVQGGVEHITDKNACIIYTPGQRQEYKHYNGVFLNGFLIFKQQDPHFLTRYGLPENEIFYISDGKEVSFLLELITYTVTDKLFDRREETKQHVRKLFETLSELRVNNNPIGNTGQEGGNTGQEGGNTGQKRMFQVKQRFTLLRDEVRKNPGEWSVKKMAKQVWFTRSRFSVLYKKFFNISPIADLTNIRIEYAKKLLETTEIPVADISAMCGYAGVEHFIRVFSKHVKYTPLKYRKANRE